MFFKFSVSLGALGNANGNTLRLLTAQQGQQTPVQSNQLSYASNSSTPQNTMADGEYIVYVCSTSCIGRMVIFPPNSANIFLQFLSEF